MASKAKILLLLGPTFLLITFFAHHVFAQASPLDITTTTVLFEFNPKPNTEIDDKVRLHNNSSSAVNLKINLKKLTQGNTGEPKLEDLGTNDEFRNWINFDKDKFTIGAQSSQDIPFVIKIPQNASFGYYYAITVTQDETAKDATVRFVGELAIPVIVNVQKPGAKVEAGLESFKPKSNINEFLPIDFETKIKNTGNVSTKVRGNIFIKGLGSKDLAILEVNPGKSSTLPGAGNLFASSWDDGFLVREPVVEDNQVLKDEKQNAKTKLKINWNKLTAFRFGKYNAYLLLVYDDGTRDVTIDATTSFWVIPYKIITAAILLFFAIIFIIKKTLSWYVKKELKRQTKNS